MSHFHPGRTKPCKCPCRKEIARLQDQLDTCEEVLKFAHNHFTAIEQLCALASSKVFPLVAKLAGKRVRGK